MSEASYHELAAGLGAEREQMARVERELTHLRARLEQAQVTELQAQLLGERLAAKEAELHTALAKIGELEQRVQELRRARHGWWRRFKKRHGA